MFYSQIFKSKLQKLKKDTSKQAVLLKNKICIGLENYLMSLRCSLCHGSFYWCGSTLIQALISNHMPSKVQHEIINPFSNLKSYTSLGINKYFHPTLYNECHYICILVLKLIYVSKTDPMEEINSIWLEYQRQETLKFLWHVKSPIYSSVWYFRW